MNKKLVVSYLLHWRSMVVILAPLVSALVFIGSTSQEVKCAYVIIVTAIYWITEALPVPVTSLLPVFAFPLLGILSSEVVCAAYMDETNMMFLGGLMVAIAVEHSNLHNRIALFTVLKVGQSPRRLLAGFMLTTMFISMWISNTATTAMMIPIVDAVSQAIEENEENCLDVFTVSKSQGNVVVDTSFSMTEEPSKKDIRFPIDPREKVAKRERLKNMYFLGTAYASSIGGTGTLMGTGTNLVVKGMLERSFHSPTNLNFSTWMAFNVPGMLLCTFFGLLWLQTRPLGMCNRNGFSNTTSDEENKVREMIQKKYEQLGEMSFHEKCVLILFLFQVILWFFREPEFIPGWATYIHKMSGRNTKFGDSIPSTLIVVILFALPANPRFGPHKHKSEDQNGPSPGCLTWEIINKKLPWGIILLLGGGFALAKASTESGLSFWLGKLLGGMSAFPPSACVLVITIAAATITEVTSNTAVASLLMPVLKDLALGICVNPLYFMLPAGVACSYAFMLPVGTPPNALAQAAANMKTSEMVKAGIIMKIICLIVINVMINTLGIAIFNIQEMPSWANSTMKNNAINC